MSKRNSREAKAVRRMDRLARTTTATEQHPQISINVCEDCHAHIASESRGGFTNLLPLMDDHEPQIFTGEHCLSCVPEAAIVHYRHYASMGPVADCEGVPMYFCPTLWEARQANVAAAAALN
jgi:hypothetical protein